MRVPLHRRPVTPCGLPAGATRLPRLLAALLGLAVVLGLVPGTAEAAVVPAAAAPAAPAPAPDTGWSGFAFDACRAPSSRVMDRWLTSSPFLGVGIYIGGSMRACSQPHLSRGWVRHQSRTGWRLLPIWVGPQAACSPYRRRISGRPGTLRRFPVAADQGRREAVRAAAAARRLGIGAGTTLWYDIEAFSPRGQACRGSALRFLSEWTRQLHRSGYASGVYSSVSAAVAALDDARTRGPAAYVVPDHVWFAWANQRADTAIARTWVRSPRWLEHRRVHQYRLDTAASYGGVRLTIDRNFVDLGRDGSARREAGPCDDVLDLRRHAHLRRGARGRQVTALQCLLRRRAAYDGPVGVVYGGRTWAAVRRFQRTRHLPATGRVDTSTWTAVLAAGAHPVLKRGSAGSAVRRLQQALRASMPARVTVNGYYGTSTVAAVRTYQRRVHRPQTGVVAGGTWHALAHGVTSSARRPHGRHGIRSRPHHKHRADRAHPAHPTHHGHAAHVVHRAHRAHRMHGVHGADRPHRVHRADRPHQVHRADRPHHRHR